MIGQVSARARPRRRQIGPVRVLVADDQPTFWDRVEAGRWEPATVDVVTRRLGPGTTLLDLGAWVGPLTLLAAGLGADVVAVEADPAALDQLRRNLAANPGLSGRVTTVDRAVSARPGNVRLGARRKRGDSMSSALLASMAESWTVEAVTPAQLATLLPSTGRVLVKLDIEGGEYDLLPAMGPLLARPGLELLLSLHPRILAETGEPDPAGRLVAALRALEGWHAAHIGQGGPEPRGRVPPALLDDPAAETWWLSREPLT